MLAALLKILGVNSSGSSKSMKDGQGADILNIVVITYVTIQIKVSSHFKSSICPIMNIMLTDKEIRRLWLHIQHTGNFLFNNPAFLVFEILF